MLNSLANNMGTGREEKNNSLFRLKFSSDKGEGSGAFSTQLWNVNIPVHPTKPSSNNVHYATL